MSLQHTPQHVLVAGASRGIGLAVVTELLRRLPNATFFATTRDLTKAPDLDALARQHSGRVVPLELDVNSEASSQRLLETITEQTASLDLVLISAGILIGEGPIDKLSVADLNTMLSTNAVGSHIVSKTFFPLLLASKSPTKTLAYIGTAAASVGQAKSISGRLAELFGAEDAPTSGYAASKAAMAMLNRQWSLFLEPRGVGVANVHPGTVRTDVLRNVASDDLVTPADSAKGVVDVILSYKIGDGDQGLLSYTGDILPY